MRDAQIHFLARGHWRSIDPPVALDAPFMNDYAEAKQLAMRRRVIAMDKLGYSNSDMQ
jgi:hypothetical protein